MTLTDNDIKEARRLGNAIDKGLIHVKDIKHFLTRLQQEKPAAPVKKNEDLTNKYRIKIRGGKA